MSSLNLSERGKAIFERKLKENGWVENAENFTPPPGMGSFAAADMLEKLLREAKFEDLTPHWHEQNPWKDNILYVPIEELATCVMALGRPFTQHDGRPIIYEMVHVMDHWNQYGQALDAYILTGPIVTAGVRFGPEGQDYLSPGFKLPGLYGLILKYGRQQRSKSACQ